MANMREYRKKAGFTQEKLAELCNTDPCYIRQIELGRRFPSIKYIERMASALGIEPYVLFCDASEASLRPGRLPAAQKETFRRALIEGVSACIRSLTDEYL
ncbi:MAG: helix-turn-helix transcriptional regulator [Treponema sp.]|nr:helix-turn-helix transcriptional regulator [Treponema sp.]